MVCFKEWNNLSWLISFPAFLSLIQHTTQQSRVSATVRIMDNRDVLLL